MSASQTVSPQVLGDVKNQDAKRIDKSPPRKDSKLVRIHSCSQVGIPASGMQGDQTEESPIAVRSLQVLFKEQQRYLNYFFEHLDYEPLEEFCKECIACKGVILFTGVGKSGFIAQKVCQTLVSTGTRAIYLNPTDALHGDIGILGDQDLIVCFSKSGATEEVIRLVPYAKAKGARTVLVTCQDHCQLSAMCDLTVILPLERELCPFNLAPVTSTALQMIFGDTLAIALMQEKRLTRDEYAMNHPAGRIGKRLMLRVDHLMLRDSALPTVAPELPIVAVLVELTSKGCGCVLVISPSGRLAGTFTDGDLRRALQVHGAALMDLPVGEVMNPEPQVCSSDIKAINAMQAMEKGPRKVTFLPVVEGENLVGLITLHGLVSAGL